jgi:hypothetical protein
MKDQEAIEHSAADLLKRRREELIYEYEETRLNTKTTVNTEPVVEREMEERIVRF